MAITKSATIGSLGVIYDFFKRFQTSVVQNKAPKESDFEDIINREFEINSNGKTVASSLKEYMGRLQKFQKKYSRFDISKPLEDPVINGNRIAFIYKVNLTTHSGSSKEVHILAIGTVENGKVSSWTQVAHQKGGDDWDA